MILRELIIQLQDLEDDGYGDKEVEIEGLDCTHSIAGTGYSDGKVLIFSQDENGIHVVGGCTEC